VKLWTASRKAATPGASVPPGTRVYAIGDIHGCLDRLRALHGLILADRDRAAAQGDAAQRHVLIYLGDYVDRGAESREVIDVLLCEPLPGFACVHLRGNHEDFLLRFLERGEDAAAWLLNGGDATFLSYGVDPYAASRDPGPRGLRAALSAAMPEDHLRFFCGLRLSHIEGDYLFVHAGLRPGVPLAEQDPEDLMWIRAPFLHSRADHGKVVVHGHTPSSAPEQRDNRIGIDTGAVYGGPLTALVLQGCERNFLQA